MTTDSIQLLPAYVDEPTHSYAASDDEAQVVDVEYTDITLEQNDLSNQDGSGSRRYGLLPGGVATTGKRHHLQMPCLLESFNHQS